MISIPLRTGKGLNERLHWAARAKSVRIERDIVGLVLSTKQRPQMPCSVILTRVAPSNGLDDDNLVGALKAVRDEVAAWLGVDDRKSREVSYRYAQERGPWGVRIEFAAPVAGAQVGLLDIEQAQPRRTAAYITGAKPWR